MNKEHGKIKIRLIPPFFCPDCGNDEYVEMTIAAMLFIKDAVITGFHVTDNDRESIARHFVGMAISPDTDIARCPICRKGILEFEDFVSGTVVSPGQLPNVDATAKYKKRRREHEAKNSM